MTSTWKWLMTLAVSALGLALAIGGYAHYKGQERELRLARQADLAFIAGMKVDSIVHWRNEQSARLATHASELVRSEYLQGMDGPDGHTRRTAIVARLDYIRQTEGWANVMLTEPSGEVLLSAAPTTEILCPPNLDLARLVVSSQVPLFGDMYLCPVCGDVHLGLAAAIRDSRDTTVAVLVALVDPGQHLFPMVQAWPTPSNSAETLLVRRDVDDVLFLNGLRHRSDPALSVRIPLNRTDVPAVQAVLGKSGLFEGLDYRDKQVLAHLEPVPESRWFMVAKVDRDEILAELHYRSGIILALVLLGILATAALGQIVYRIRKAQVAQRLLDLERDRRQAHEEARVTLYSIGDGVITTDRHGRITRMNSVAETLTGWTETDSRGMPLEDIFTIVNEETRATVENPVSRVLREGTIVGLANHTTLIARDGTERPIADSGAPIRDDQGNITGVVLVFRDQSEERAAENALRASEERYRALVELSPDAVFVNRDNRIDFVNKAALALFGATEPGQLLGRSPFDVFHPDYHPIMGQRIARLLEGSTVPLIEGQILRLDGTSLDVEVTASPFGDVADRAIQVILRDISDRKRTEAALQASEERYRLLFQYAPLGIFTATGDGNPIDMNPAMARILGFASTREALDHYKATGKPSYIQPMRRDTFVRMLKDNEQVHNFEYEAVTVDGRNIWLSMNARIASTLPDGTPTIEGFTTDVTDRKHAELALRKSERFLQQIFDILPVGLWFADKDGRLVRGNPAGVAIWGAEPKVSPEEYGVFKARRLPSGDGILAQDWALARTIRDGETVTEELLEIDTFDGRKRVILNSTAPVKDDAGTIQGAIVVNLDITDRQRAEDALHTEQDNMRATMAATPIPLIVFDETELIVMANPAAERLFDQTVDSLRQRRCGDLLGCTHRHDDPGECGSTVNCSACTLYQGIRNALVGQQALWDSEVETQVDSDRSAHWFTARIEPLQLSGRRHAVLALHDITARKRTEEALRESEMHFRHMADSGQALIWTAGIDKKCDYFNKIWLDFTGRSLQQELGDGWLESVHPDDMDHCMDVFVNSFDKREPFSMEYRMKRHDGEYRWIRDDGSPRYDSHGRFIGYIGHCLDVTDRREAEEERRRFEATARQQQKLESIGTLASGVAHEINNPLNVILNYGQLLLDKPEDTDQVTDFATQIVKESERVAVIVRNLLAFSRQDKETHSPARMMDIVDRTLSMTHAVLRKDQITVQTNIPADLPTIKCRSQQIQQVLLNLLTNARDAMNQIQSGDPGSKEILISAGVAEIEGKQWLRLSVRDRGGGIPRDVAGRVFDPFFTTKTRDKGTGLGLAISYGIVQDHQGRLWFETEEGLGTTFHVDLPIDNEWSFM